MANIDCNSVIEYEGTLPTLSTKTQKLGILLRFKKFDLSVDSFRSECEIYLKDLKTQSKVKVFVYNFYGIGIGSFSEFVDCNLYKILYKVEKLNFKPYIEKLNEFDIVEK